MPALNPPGMQIGALPPGFGPLPPAGPPLAYGQNVAPPKLVQQVSGATSAAAPATASVTIAATQAGSMLVALVSYAQSGAPTVPTPAGYTAVAVGGNPGNTLGGRIYYQANVASGITSFALAGLAGINGVAIAVYEFQNVYVADNGYGGGQGNQGFSNASTTPNVQNYPSPAAGPVVLIGFECDVTGQAYTPANVGVGWTPGTTATSTAGATNTIIRPFSVVTSPVETLTYQLAGTLAGSIASGACLLSLICATSGPLNQPQPQAFPGAVAAVAGWGALGGTKPGGAGGGQ